MLTQWQRNIIDNALGKIEDTLIYPFIKINEIDTTPIFIVGVPRSGTTIFTQWFVNYIDTDFSYFSRVGDLFPSASLLTNLVGYKFFGKDVNINKPSKYGQIKGYMALSEGNRIWHRYLNSETDHVDLTVSNEKMCKFLTKSVKKHCYFFNSQLFINKSPHNSLRINFLKSIFPKSKFVVVLRDGRDVTKSLIEARKHFNQRTDKWWSVKPNNWKVLESYSPHISCSKQWEAITCEMLKQINEIDANSQIIIKYEDFIKKPFSIIKKCYKKLDIPYKTYDEQFNNIIKSSSYKQFFKSIEIDEINNAISGTLKRLGY